MTQQKSYCYKKYQACLKLSDILCKQLTFANPLQDKVDGLDNHFQTQQPNEVIGVMGKRGAGKTKLLNALLGQDMLAVDDTGTCTAAPTIVKYSPGDKVHVVINFKTEEEWKQEVQYLQGDIEDWDDEVDEFIKESAPYYVAKEILSAAYNTEDFMKKLDMPPKEIQEGFTLKSFKRTATFKIKKFIEEYTYNKGKGKWAMVKNIVVLGNFDILKDGLVLVDLPGTEDGSYALGRSAEDYKHLCTQLVFVLDVKQAKTKATFRQISDLVSSEEPHIIAITHTDTLNSDEMDTDETSSDEIDSDTDDENGEIRPKKRQRLDPDALEQAFNNKLKTLESDVRKGVATAIPLKKRVEGYLTITQNIPIFTVSSLAFLDSKISVPVFQTAHRAKLSRIEEFSSYLQSLQQRRHGQVSDAVQNHVNLFLSAAVQIFDASHHQKNETDVHDHYFQTQLEIAGQLCTNYSNSVADTIKTVIDDNVDILADISFPKHHKQFKAICRRLGIYQNNRCQCDLNRAFLSNNLPSIRRVIATQSREFAQEISALMKGCTCYAIQNQSSPDNIMNEIAEVEQLLTKNLKVLVRNVEECMVQFVKENLEETYNCMANEKGPGAVKRMTDQFDEQYREHFVFESASLNQVRKVVAKFFNHRRGLLQRRASTIGQSVQQQSYEENKIIEQILPIIHNWNNLTPDEALLQIEEIQKQTKPEACETKAKKWINKLSEYKKKWELLDISVEFPAHLSGRYGYMYIMSNEYLREGIFRVGATAEDPQQRADQFSIMDWSSFKVVYSLCMQNFEACELVMHQLLNNLRVNVGRGFYEAPLKLIIDLLVTVAREIDPHITI